VRRDARIETRIRVRDLRGSVIALGVEALGGLWSSEQVGVALHAAPAGDLYQRVDPDALVP